MPHDAARVADTRGWLLKARGVQRSLAWHDVPFRKTHDLAEIGLQCLAVDVSLEPVCRRAERLTSFAWIFRYPGEVEEPPAAEIADALALAREVYDAILARLPAEVRPPE